MVGDVPVGGREPMRVQSMTTTPTWDAEATVEQIAQLAEVGCEIVRVTVPTMRDAEALPRIRELMAERGLRLPLVADIHFAPKLAMICADSCEKVRVNPGNFVDSKKWAVREYSDAEYAAELARIEEAFTPLVLKLKSLGRALRIGTNHGSLSDRILNRYGDTPLGMVESAMEFVRICRKHDYHELCLSMKASNPVVMIQAYRLLAARMDEEGTAESPMDYPFHLGVTEAGDGLDARVKSAVGIGSLLLDGIGDTIRVSLTEDPCAEVPVGFALAELVSALPDREAPASPPAWPVDPVLFQRRESVLVDHAGLAYGGRAMPRVEVDFGDRADHGEPAPSSAAGEGIEMIRVALSDAGALDAVREALRPSLEQGALVALGLSEALARSGPDGLCHHRIGRVELPAELLRDNAGSVPLAAWREWCADTGVALGLVGAPEVVAEARPTLLAAGITAPVLVLTLSQLRPGLEGARAALAELGDSPLIWALELDDATDDSNDHALDPVLAPATLLGALLCDGLGDGVRVRARRPHDGLDPVELAYTILQAARLRTTRTEFIACPSCGRTLFNLEETTQRIRALTGHLPNVKIAIMGCIVNGPGEMADADFGYVGWKPGKVDLYVGKDVVEKAIPEAEAPGRLVELLKREGAWVEPATPAASS